MNMEIKDFNSKIMGRIRPMIMDAKIIEDIRFSLIAAHDAAGRKVDLARLSVFPDGDFWHDVIGIDNHASRDFANVGLLTDGFAPRCGFEH